MDSYQAIYDAVRSRISGGNVGDVVADAARQAFDISHSVAMLRDSFSSVAYEMARPFVLLRPKVFIDQSHWCALYGDNLQDGVAGFGDSPAAASYDFDKNWSAIREPNAPDIAQRDEAAHKHVGSAGIDRGETCLTCGKDMYDPIHGREEGGEHG